MDLVKIYNAVNAIIDAVDFNSLFDGFHKYRFALYSSTEIVIDGKTLPYCDDFRGNTSILYDGEYIAIWNIEFDPIDDVEQLAYCLIHEMFHCHQRVNNEQRYPSDFTLLNYPDDIDNFIKKHTENSYLADAYELCNMELLQKFAFIRGIRYNTYPSMVAQEFKAETLEGMAEYIGLNALKQLNAEKFRATVADYLSKLRSESNLIFDIRRISYFVGTIFFLCLEQLGFSVKNVIDSDLTAYEQNSIDTSGVTAEILPCDSISGNYTQVMKEKENTVTKHISHSDYIACEAFICGYDPMNMFRVGNIIYCSHFVYLNENGTLKPINSAVALKLAENSDQSIIGYYI